MKAKINGFEVEGTPKEIGELLNLGKPVLAGKTVVKKVAPKKRGVAVSGYTRWSVEQDSFLVDNVNVYPRSKLARMINKTFGTSRSTNAVFNRIDELKNNKSRKVVKSTIGSVVNKQRYSVARTNNRWTVEQDGFLMDNIAVYPRKKLARMFNKEFNGTRTVQSVCTRLWEFRRDGKV